jgi:hypothetical protein
MNGGCSIYEDRPENPCKSYKCQWLIDENINAVISFREKGGRGYLHVIEAGEKLRVEVLNWLVHFAIEKKANIQYAIDGGVNCIGDSQFMQLMKEDDPILKVRV